MCSIITQTEMSSYSRCVKYSWCAYTYIAESLLYRFLFCGEKSAVSWINKNVSKKWIFQFMLTAHQLEHLKYENVCMRTKTDEK